MSDTIYNTQKLISQDTAMESSNVPYVYYLEWTSLNKKYIGCRYAKDCHPDDLFVKYFTSSKFVKELLDNGQYPDIIKILSTHSTADEALEEEKRLLIDKDCVNRDDYLNASVGWNGSDNMVNMKKINDKRIRTNLKKYNVKYTFKNPDVRKKIDDINTILYGYTNPLKNEKIYKKSLMTSIKLYNGNGDETNVFQIDHIKEKIKETNNQKYGYDHRLQNDEELTKNRIAYIEKYGNEEEKKLLEKGIILKPTQLEYFKKESLRSFVYKNGTDQEKRDFENGLITGISQLQYTKDKIKSKKKPCPFGCRDNHLYDPGNFKQHMKKVHKWENEQVDKYNSDYKNGVNSGN